MVATSLMNVEPMYYTQIGVCAVTLVFFVWQFVAPWRQGASKISLWCALIAAACVFDGGALLQDIGYYSRFDDYPFNFGRWITFTLLFVLGGGAVTADYLHFPLIDGWTSIAGMACTCLGSILLGISYQVNGRWTWFAGTVLIWLFTAIYTGMRVWQGIHGLHAVRTGWERFWAWLYVLLMTLTLILALVILWISPEGLVAGTSISPDKRELGYLFPPTFGCIALLIPVFSYQSADGAHGGYKAE
jgi:hypothetical protein